MGAVGAWIFVLVIVSALAGYFVFVAPDPVKLGRKLALKRHPELIDPWMEWKASKANLDASRKRDHEAWQADFDRLVQRTCTHLFPATGSRPTYYTCLKCKYEEPWDGPHEGCICRYETVTTLTSPFPEYNVLHRHGNCKWHGIDYPVNRRTDRSQRPFNSNHSHRDRWISPA